MSIFTMTAHRQAVDAPPSPAALGIGGRARRALALAGTLGVLIGEIVGILQINPQFLRPWIPAAYANPRTVAVAGMALMGLACGMVVGLILRGTSYLLRLSITLFIVLVGLITSELTQGLLLALPLSRALTRMSDMWEAQLLGIGALGAVAGALSGYRRRIQFDAAAPAPPVTASRRPARRPARPRQRSGRRPASSRAVAAVAAGGAVSTRRRVAVAPRSAGRQRASWKLWGRRRSIHLGRQTSEVCPYCLEEVKPHDRRGRVVCDICGTAHHGDCWAITGKCEVPHLQT